MKKTLLILGILLAFASLVWFTQRDTGVPIASASPTPSTGVSASPIPTLSPMETELPSPSPTNEPAPAIHTITYSDDGYTPASITINKGDTVVFSNKSTRPAWTASDVHPTHKAYPGSGIDKCGNPDPNNFDACRGYAPGEDYSFTFNQVGTWEYHNHSNSRHGGTVIVR